MKKAITLIFVLSLLSLTGCTQDMVDDVFDAIPFIGIDEEISRAVDLGKPGECEKLKADDPNQELRRKNKCFQLVAEKIKDPKVCRMIVGDDNRWNNCYKNIAMENKDGNLCEEITKDSTKNSCYLEVAITSGDDNICAKEGFSSYDKKKCYTEIATIKKDDSICEKIENDNNKNECLQYVGIEAENVDICEKISNKPIYKIRCINGVATKKADTSVCYKHTATDDKNLCISIVAEETNNISLCNQINDNEGKEGCISDIAKNRKDETICEDLGKDQKAFCYKAIAEAKKEVDACDKIDNSTTKADCYKEVAALTGNLDLCLSMNMEDIFKKDCFQEASKKAQDATPCKSIADTQALDECVTNVASYQRSAVHCGLNISDENRRHACIKAVVDKYRHEKVCNEITDPGDKAKCMEYVEEYKN